MKYTNQMKNLLVILVFLQVTLSFGQDEPVLFSDALRVNFSKYISQSNKAYRLGDFERGQYLFDSLVQHQLIGSKFDNYTLKRVSDRKLKMSKVKKPIFLITYAAWCVPSKGEFLALNKLAKEYHNEVEFIVIVWGKKKEVKNYSSKLNSRHIEVCYAHKSFKSGNEIVENLRETLGFPTCYMIDSYLQVIDIKRGAASIPLHTPTKKALELNYNFLNERLTLLTEFRENNNTILAKK